MKERVGWQGAEHCLLLQIRYVIFFHTNVVYYCHIDLLIINPSCLVCLI